MQAQTYTLVLLNLFTAFDTVDHKILTSRLKAARISGLAVSWLVSVLRDHTQEVELGYFTSSIVKLGCSVLQGTSLHTA